MSVVVSPDNPLSVGFEPGADTRNGLTSPPDLAQHPVANRILARFFQPLAELGRRARRVGPVGQGALVLLAGCHENSGCSTMALCCAASAASQEPTALVDADLSGRGLTQLLIDRPAMGWDDVVSGAGSMEQAVHYVDARESLAFFPIRSAAINFSLLDGRSELTGWLARLRQDYPLVFLDGGSVSNGVTRWGPWVDAALIVCDPARSDRDQWTCAWNSLEEKGAHVLGIVETFV